MQSGIRIINHAAFFAIWLERNSVDTAANLVQGQCRPGSALEASQTSQLMARMSAFAGKVDMTIALRSVRF